MSKIKLFLAAVLSALILSSCMTDVLNESDSGDMVTESISEETSFMNEETTVTTADASETKAVVI
ncbi:MAG: hypothetical protein J1E40_02955, partial [Oscillospiraceae bacterium]|nr:hypothetical protein [Oscillospiraceae bacterium]